MISFKKFLLENRIDWLKKNIDSVDTSHDMFARHHEPHDVIDHFAQHADPTRKKVYTQWLMNQYKKKNIRQEDSFRLHGTLSSFEEHKHKLENRDINQYKHPSDLEDALRPHEQSERELSKRQQTKQIKHEGADLIHDDKEKGVTVHHIKTEDAAKHYGKGTRWCTAADNNNMFDEYNETGPLLLIQHGGKKYQAHSESGQFADEEDRETNFGGVHPDVSKSLAKSNHPDVRKMNFMFDNPHHEVTDEDAIEYSKSKYDFVRHKLAQRPEFAHHLMNDEDIFIRGEVAYKNPHLAKKMVNDPDSAVRSMVANHSELAGKLVDDSHSIVRAAVAEHPEHAHHFVKDRNTNVRSTAAQHHELAHHFVDDPDDYIRAVAAESPIHADKFVNDPSVGVRRTVAARHPKQAGKMVNDEDSGVRYEVARHSEHAGKLVNDPDPSVREQVAKHPEHAGKLVNDDNSYVRMHVAKHPEHAGKLINDESTNVRAMAAMHPHLAQQLENDPDKLVRKKAKDNYT